MGRFRSVLKEVKKIDFSLNFQKYISPGYAVIMSKSDFFKISFQEKKWTLKQKVRFLLLSIVIWFLLLKAKYQTKIVDRPKFRRHPLVAKAFSYIKHTGLERQCLKGSAVAGFNHATTITKVSAKGLDTRQDDHSKGICSPGSLVNNPVR